MNRCVAIYCGVTLCLVSCTRTFVPNAHQKMLDAAETIVKQPHNWKNNSSAVVQFINAASDAGAAEEAVVLAFQSNATALVTFGTKWTQSADSSQIQEYTRLVARLLDQDRVAVSPTKLPEAETSSTASLEYEEAQTKKKVVDLISRYLDGSDSKEFRRTWESALDSYKALRARFKEQARWVWVKKEGK
jgi:hypothetical protein